MNLPPTDVLDAWGFVDATITRITVGLINLTFRIETSRGAFALQRLHSVFRGEVNSDIDALTRRLESAGLPTPRIVPTSRGDLWHPAADGAWRVTTWLPGATMDRSEDPAHLESAGALVARFHHALAGQPHSFAFTRPGAHDTAAHLARLAAALDQHRDHRRREAVAPLAEAILAHPRPQIPELPTRIVHGDLKLSNVLFREGRAHALIDLDTLQHATLATELGDALRSWCNPRGEDVREAGVDAVLFAAAVRGYASVAGLGDERRAIVPGLETIALELASRFCLDALEERYFGWNRERFSSASEHHELRARGQLALARDVAQRRAELERTVDDAFA